MARSRSGGHGLNNVGGRRSPKAICRTEDLWESSLSQWPGGPRRPHGPPFSGGGKCTLERLLLGILLELLGILLGILLDLLGLYWNITRTVLGATEESTSHCSW